MKRFKCLIIALALVLASLPVLTACSEYVSSYSATMMVRSSGKDSCSVKFGTLNGRLVLNTKKTSDGEGRLHYTASLDEGKLKVYYDSAGEKEELFEIGAGESIDSRGGCVESGKKVYVIIEANDAKGGEIKIDLN